MTVEVELNDAKVMDVRSLEQIHLLRLVKSNDCKVSVSSFDAKYAEYQSFIDETAKGYFNA